MGKEHEIVEIAITGFFVSSVLMIVYYMGLRFILQPRFKYIEILDDKEPDFNDRVALTVDISDKSLTYELIKERVSKYWVLTYSNDQTNTLKFRERIGLSGWGVGIYFRIDELRKEAYAACFSFAGYNESNEKLTKKLRTVIDLILADK